jgi:starvation-inducible DNA-binding protein
MKTEGARARRMAPLDTPSDLAVDAKQEISAALTTLLADMFALYVKTKNFHWHVSGPHFRDYHLMLDEQGTQIFATTDDIAERVRKLGGTTIRSIGHIGRLQRVLDNEADYVKHPICCPNFATIIFSWPRVCVRHTRSATNTKMSPLRV